MAPSRPRQKVYHGARELRREAGLRATFRPIDTLIWFCMVSTMLRSLIGGILILHAAVLALQAADDSTSPLKDSRSMLEQLSQPRELTAQDSERLKEEVERLNEELRRPLENRARVERMLVEKRASLKDVGPTFEITVREGALSGSGLVVACLVDQTGKIYTYDTNNDATAQTTSLVNEVEFLKATNLAKSLGHVEWQPKTYLNDIGITTWIMSFHGTRTLLKIAGAYVGELPDPRVSELVKLIDGWCPYSQEIRSHQERLEERFGPPY